MIVLLAQFSFPAASRTRVLELARRMDVETTRESGCEYYGHAVDVRDENRIVLGEWWRDPASLLAHFRTPHFREFRHRSRELGIRATLLQVDGQPIAMEDDRYWRVLLERAESQS